MANNLAAAICAQGFGSSGTHFTHVCKSESSSIQHSGNDKPKTGSTANQFFQKGQGPVSSQWPH